MQQIVLYLVLETVEKKSWKSRKPAYAALLFCNGESSAAEL